MVRLSPDLKGQAVISYSTVSFKYEDFYSGMQPSKATVAVDRKIFAVDSIFISLTFNYWDRFLKYPWDYSYFPSLYDELTKLAYVFQRNSQEGHNWSGNISIQHRTFILMKTNMKIFI